MVDLGFEQWCLPCFKWSKTGCFQYEIFTSTSQIMDCINLNLYKSKFHNVDLYYSVIVENVCMEKMVSQTLCCSMFTFTHVFLRGNSHSLLLLYFTCIHVCVHVPQSVCGSFRTTNLVDSVISFYFSVASKDPSPKVCLAKCYSPTPSFWSFPFCT